ncbi:MAG: methyltransferase domain-containing protein [Gammaproteobacteria bacterium]|nr:methyltransferase domain-containing protein [Gammaproteobacteria bacterium]
MQKDKHPIREYWDGVAREFECRPFHLDPFLGKLKRDAYLGLVQRWAPRHASGTVLKTDLFEECFGPDALVPGLAEHAEFVVGFDVSPKMARLAEAKFGNHNRFIAADVRRLPFASDYFDLIVSPSTLDHFEDPRDLGISLQELARILKPNGRLIVSLDNRQNIFDPLLRLISRFGWIPFYLGRSYTAAELRQELETVGFKVHEATAILHNPRLVAVASIGLARKLGWKPLQRFVQRSLEASQCLEQTRLRYYTGSFVAALAVKRT